MSVSENDKRWLVVLVATDKIVAPLLRDFVAKGIDKLKDFLNDHLQNISTGYTLETMTYLLCHPPPPASPDPYLKYLKFQNINNNEGLSKVNYNYSVNNVVDLAKLYLPGYLAKFAAFDNSMDMSAALRLLGYNDYPTQVFVSSNPFLDIKSLADDVRNTVRNPGAHYNESIWTDLFMNQCFEKLVALVKAFVLPADQEKDALDQLHRWKSNGWKLIIAKDLSDLMETLLQNRDVNIDSPETRRRLNILVTLLDRCDSVEERVSLTEEQLSLTEERVSLTEEHLGLVKERQDELQRLVEEVIENLKENRVNQISGAHGQLEVPAVTTSSPFSRTSVVSADDLSEEASHMNKESGDETSESSSSSGVSENCIDSSGVNPPTSPFSRTSVVSADDLRGEASHMNEESGDEACEGSTSSGVSENCIDSFGEDLPENQPHVERINPDIVLLQRQNGAPFKIEFTGKLPEGMESGVADFENLRTGVEIVKMGVKTLVGAALPYSSRQGAFKVTVFSQNREKCLGETKVVYIDLIGAALEKAVTCPETMRKFIQAAIPCLNEHSEGDTCDAENLTNSGPSGREKSSLSVQLLQRFIYAAAKINSVWFIRLIFELPAGRIAFDSYKGRPLLPEYVARARGHNEIAVYLRDVTKRYSESEITDEEKLRAINWQEIVTAIEATQENPNLSREGAFKVTVSSHNREKCLEETKVADIELIEETLKQAISYPNTMLKFIQAAIPRLNEHSEGGTSDAENHTNGGPSGWEKSLLSLQLLQKFIYAAAKVNAVWFIRLIFDLPAGRIAFDSYKGRPLLPEYVARARGHNEIAEYLEDVTKRYSEIERTDEEKFDAINWQEIVTAIEATQENPKNTESHRKRSDDLKSNVSPQEVRGKEPWSNFSDEQLNYFKFALIVINEFSKALRKMFRTMWDRTFGNIVGFKPWDDSLEVRNLFLMAEGGRTKVPTHLSYEEWSIVYLVQATIFARSFAMPDSRGHHRTLFELYVIPRRLPPNKFHTSVISPTGCDLESSVLAIDQLRMLRNYFSHSLRAEIDKVTFDHLVQLAKEAFIALGIATAQIDAIALKAFDPPSLELCEVEDGIKQDIGASVDFLEGVRSSLKESGEIIETLRQEHDQTKNTESHRKRSDDLKFSVSPQQVRGKEPWSNFSDEQLNYFKFALIVKNHFHKALCQTFRTMWDNTFGNIIGFKPWDDSLEVRNLFLKAEGGKTRVPTHLSYEEWEFSTLLHATIYARSFARPDSRGHHRNLSFLYVRPRLPLPNKFHTSVMSPVGCDLESSVLAIDQLRMLRNYFSHSLRAEIDKVIFDHLVQLAKEAFIALGIATAQIDAIALIAFDSPSLVLCEVEDGIKQDIAANVNFLEGFSSSLEESEEIIEAMRQENDQTTKNCNEVPPQISLTVPKMSDIKVFRKKWSDVQFPIDILLLTVEEFEFLSSFAYLENPFKSYDQNVGDVYFGNIGQLRVALVKSHGNTTPVDYAVSLEKAIIKMRPKVVFLVGICGSLNSAKARIGDVLITSKLGTYSQRGMRALESKLSSSLVRFVGEGWMAPLRDHDDREVRIHRGGLLLCVQDRKMSEELIQSHPDAFAIEVRDALATAITDIKVECIAVRGISHYGDASEESEGWKTFASVMAASVVATILEKGAVFEDWPHFQGTLPSPCLPPRDINFVGRERECEKIIVCSGFENTRLVSICGPPGFGKTSVAVAVGHELGSMGLPVYLFSLRDFQSKVDVTKMLLDFFKETAPIRQTPPCSSIDEQIIQHLSVISEQTVLVLDGADRLLGNIDFLNFLEDVLSRAEKLKLIITAVESFSLRHHHSHEAVRVGALDESSAKKLVSKLLPDATASDYTQLLEISKNIPLLLKIICHSISEGNDSVNSFLDLLRAEKRALHRLLDSDVIGPTRDSLHGRLDEVFRKRPKKEREAFVSLSVFPNDFDVKVAAVVMGVTRIVEAKRILRHLYDSSLLESGSKPESFSMHSLARSFAQEIGETEFIGTLVTSDTRFREFYISHFMKLNEEFLTGDSMMAFVTFYEDEENIVQCLKLRPGSDSKTAEAVFKALVHAELFLHALYWTDEDRFVSIYDAAVKAAETLGEKEFHRELLVSSAFNEVTRDTRERGWQLLSEAKQLQKAALSTSDREKGKLMCYLGIYHLCNGEREEGQHCLQESLPRIEGNLEETVLRLTISQILHMHDRFYTKSSSRAQCYKKILQEYTEAGNTDLLITSTLENTGKNSVEKVKDERDTLKKRPLMTEVLFLVSKATESLTDIETKRRLSDIAVNVLRENETTSPSTILNISRFHTNLRMLTNDEGEGLEKERQFREHAFGKSYLQSRVINSDLSSKTSAKFTINTQHGTHCLPDALQAEQRELAVRMSLLGPNDASTADSYYSLGVQQYASGDFTSSLESFMGALNIRRKCFGDTNSGTADCYHSVGVTQHALGDFISASQSLKSALDVRLKLPGEHRQYTAHSYHSLGATQLAMGDYNSARESFQHGLNIRLNTFGEMHVSTAESYHSLGNTARSLGDFASALQSYHRAFEIIRKHFGEEHPRTAEIYHSIGEVQSSLGDLTSARKSHQCALNIRLKVLGEEHHSTAESYQSIGDVNVSLKDWKSALQFYQLALNIRVKAFGEKHLITADSYRSIGETHFALNDLTSALQSFQCERNIRLKVLGEEHPSIANSYHLIGDAHFALNDFMSALQSFQCALDIRLKVFGEEHCGTADSYHSLGETFYTLNDLTPAFQSFHHALSIRVKLFGEDHSETAESYHTLGVTEYAQGNYSSALNFSQKALDISHKLFRGDNQDTIEIYLTLGTIHYQLGNFDSAVQSFQSALVTGLKHIGKDHSRRADNYNSLGDTQHAKGDFNSAVESYKNALHIKLKLLGKSHK